MENDIKHVKQLFSEKFKIEYNPKTKSNYPIKLIVNNYKYGFQSVEKAMIFCMERF